MNTETQNQDDILKALSHPARMEILRQLKEPGKHFSEQHMSLDNGVCAGQFERCGLSQSTVSAHLATLLRANLLVSTKVGQWIFYKRNEQAIAAFLRDLAVDLA